jgi:putative peptidoglycan lipid II flippase
LRGAGADGPTADVVADLALGTRLSAVVLLPVSALLTLFGTALGVALFSFGAGSAGEGSTRLGATLAASAFGLLPFAVTMLQARVFYALTDSRTPTLLQLVIVVVKIPLLLAAPFVLPPQWVVLGLAAANGLSFVVGWVLGQILLHRRLGPLGTGAVLGVLVRVAVASVFGAVLAYGAVLLIGPALPAVGPVAGSWIELMIATVIGGPAIVVAMLALRVPEVAALQRRVIGKMARPTERGDSGR